MSKEPIVPDLCWPSDLDDFPPAMIGVAAKLDAECKPLALSEEGATSQPVDSQDYLILRLRRGNDEVSLSAVLSMRVTIKVLPSKGDGAYEVPLAFEAYRSAGYDYVRFEIDGKDFGAEPADRVAIHAEVTGPAGVETKPRTFYTVLRTRVDGYGDTLNLRFSSTSHRRAPVGLWLPIGLFATNFDSDGHGLPFSVLPIGFAIGSKLYLGNFYIGLSAMANWALSGGVKREAKAQVADPGVKPEADDDEGAAADFTLQSAATGFLFDINGGIYLGSAYIFDFRESHEDPGWVLVIGAAANLLDI